MQDWLNRIGLTLQFAALFLVTPEIVGAARMRTVAEKLQRPLPTILTAISDVFPRSPRPADAAPDDEGRSGDPAAAGVMALVSGALGALVTFAPPMSHHTGFVRAGEVLLVVALSLLALLLIGVGLLVMGDWLEAVITSEHSFLALGACLFALGFAVLMWATFVGPAR